MTKAIIVDLDGTLSDSSHRQHHMEKKPKDWKSFYDGMVDDKPNEWCKWLVTHFRETHVIILVSGRPDDYREKTEKWLSRYGIYYNVLHMRKAGDFRADFIIKKEIYDAHIKPDYQIEFCVDDRKQVVDLWRSEGLVCLQCAEGNF